MVSGCVEDHENILPSHLCRMNTEHEIDILCALRILKQILTLVSESLIVVAGDKCCSSPPAPHIIVNTQHCTLKLERDLARINTYLENP